MNGGERWRRAELSTVEPLWATADSRSKCDKTSPRPRARCPEESHGKYKKQRTILNLTRHCYGYPFVISHDIFCIWNLNVLEVTSQAFSGYCFESSTWCLLWGGLDE